MQTLTKALDEVRKQERREKSHPKTLRWAVLKSMDNYKLKEKQLVADQGATANAWIIKEKLRWIRRAPTARGARWHVTNYLKAMRETITGHKLIKLMTKALNTLERHADQFVRRWYSGPANARLRGMNGLFQTARYRARG